MDLYQYVLKNQQRGINNADRMIREATDVAKTPPSPYEIIRYTMGFSPQKYCFDLCVLKENFEKRNDFDAEI